MLPNFLIAVIVLSIVILIHELGHFLAAKKIGVKVEEFGLGYPPRAIGKKIGETIYSINWLPFGGFVRLFGELDDTEQRSKSNRAFYNRKKREKALVILAGVFMNIVLAIFCFSIVYSIRGIPEEVDSVFIDGFDQNSEALMNIFESGDEIISINGEEFTTIEDFREYEKKIQGEKASFLVERKGEKINIELDNFEDRIVVEKTLKDSSAEKAGIKAGDKIKTVNGINIYAGSDLIEYLKDKDGQNIVLEIIRDNELMKLNIVPQKNEEGVVMMGISFHSELIIGNIDSVFYPVWQMPFRGTVVGLKNTYGWTIMMFQGLGGMVADSFAGVRPEVSGIVGIVQTTGVVAKMGILALIEFVGILSVNLAVVNILPIPALDGGRFAFMVFEKIIGKSKPKLEATLNMIGMVFLIGLMVLVTFWDVKRLLGK